ncbi:MAG: response regulator [Myxococcota bacterium]
MKRQPTVLISDDDPMILGSLARQALRHGLAVIRDSDSRAPTLAKLLPDVILLDLFQGSDGKELLCGLKSDPDTRHIPVIVMTGLDDDTTSRECFELGAEAVVPKPFPPSFMSMVAQMAAR